MEPMDDEPDGIMCTAHIRPVGLAPGDVLICHQDDGSYCRSEQFAVETLTRGQVMNLLMLARGERMIRQRSARRARRAAKSGGQVRET